MGFNGLLLLGAGLQLAGVSGVSGVSGVRAEAHPDTTGADTAASIQGEVVASASTVSASRAAEASVYDGSLRELVVPQPRLEEPSIRLDGRLDEEAWEAGAVLSGFTQYDPTEGIAATQETRVRVLVTSEAILFGIQAFDGDPDGVRATLAQRDGFGRSDDYVRVLLDTFNDNRRAYVFQVNPLGVQGDGVWVEGSRREIDWNPDFLWESAGQVGPRGYSVEVRVPLNSLRFPDAPLQDWGLQVMRRIQRNGFEASWAPLTGERASTLAQSGRLQGLEGLEPGRLLDVNPVVTARRQGGLDPETGRFSRSSPTGDVGMNLTYGLTSNLTLDATYNPDFSQVEADAGQITVNERFALYFPEKRPFFLEGTDIFSMPRNLVYTRSIANPVGAAKVSGKVGGVSVAYIGALDRSGSAAGDPAVNLLRVKGDVGGSSTVGMVYTDRTASGESFNRVLGSDARIVLARRYTLDVMAAASADGRPEEDTRWGSLFLASLSRASRSLSLRASFEDVSRGFRARSGFIRRVGTTQVDGRVGYTWRGEAGALVERWGPSLSLEGYWERPDFWDGKAPRETELSLSFSASFRGNVGGYLSLSRDSYTFAAADYESLFLDSPEPTPFRPQAHLFQGLWSLRLRSWISRWERARISLGASLSETPIFHRAGGGVPADVAERLNGDVDLTLYLTSSFTGEVGLRHVTLLRKRDGSRYSSATIPRLEARYQFSRALFVRGIGEYSSQRRGGILDPVSGTPVLSCDEDCQSSDGSSSHDLRLEGLVGYEPSPGTVVYLGYSRQMESPTAFGLGEVRTRADGLFLKMSYRFRM